MPQDLYTFTLRE